MCESCNSLVFLLFSATSIKEREESNVLPLLFESASVQSDVFDRWVIMFDQNSDHPILQPGAVVFLEESCIPLPVSKVPERMPMLVVVTTDHITAWSIFYLKHHSLMVLWGGLPPLVDYSTMKELFLAVV